MTAQPTSTTEKPDYFIVNNEIVCNPAAIDLNKNFNELKRQKELLKQSRIGADLLQALVSMPSLQSFTITFNGEYESNDEGGTFICINGYTRDVVITDGSVKTEMELEELFNNSDTYSGIYDALTYPHECTGFNIKIERSKVAHLLESGQLSGSQAFEILLSKEVRSQDTLG